MTSDTIQQTLDGDTVPVRPVHRELRVFLSPAAFNVTDRAKYLGDIPKGAFIESWVRIGGALSRMIPEDVVMSLGHEDPDTIRRTVLIHVVQYLKDNPDFPFLP